jgi:hypothetical protein
MGNQFTRNPITGVPGSSALENIYTSLALNLCQIAALSVSNLSVNYGTMCAFSFYAGGGGATGFECISASENVEIADVGTLNRIVLSAGQTTGNFTSIGFAFSGSPTELGCVLKFDDNLSSINDVGVELSKDNGAHWIGISLRQNGDTGWYVAPYRASVDSQNNDRTIKIKVTLKNSTDKGVQRIAIYSR